MVALAYFMVHLRIAYTILERRPDILDSGAFLLGSLSPDAIMFRPGRSRFDKSSAHFCVGDAGWSYYTNYEEWLHSLLKNIHNFSGTVDRDFLLGYMSHVMTDIENTRRFWTPVRLADNREYMDTYLNDCKEIDSILLNQIQNIDNLWLQLKNANKYCLAELFTIDDNSKMIETMESEMYFNRYPSDYTPSIFTLSEASRFIDETAELILNEIQKDNNTK